MSNGNILHGAKYVSKLQLHISYKYYVEWCTGMQGYAPDYRVALYTY